MQALMEQYMDHGKLKITKRCRGAIHAYRRLHHHGGLRTSVSGQEHPSAMIRWARNLARVDACPARPRHSHRTPTSVKVNFCIMPNDDV